MCQAPPLGLSVARARVAAALRVDAHVHGRLLLFPSIPSALFLGTF